MEEAGTGERLEELRASVQEVAGGSSQGRARAGKEKKADDPVRRIARVFSVPSGHTIWVARGGREGDELLRRFAKGSDLWLHTRDVPGSHVVLRKEAKDETVPEKTLLDAGGELLIQAVPLAQGFHSRSLRNASRISFWNGLSTSIASSG